jgi:hypothetical protein
MLRRENANARIEILLKLRKNKTRRKKGDTSLTALQLKIEVTHGMYKHPRAMLLPDSS